MQVLGEQDVRAVLPMPDLIAAMEQALVAYSSGRAVQPVRTVLEVGAERNYFGVMPAALDEPRALGAKLVTVYHGNHARGLPSHLATIVLLDHATGAPVAVVDGRYITEARTGAVSAVSAKLLAREDASILAVIGSGVQARSHIEAIRHVRTLRDVRVWSPHPSRRGAFVEEMRRVTGLAIRAMEDAASAVQGADLIVLATASGSPVIADGDVADGAHIMAVGACRPDQREMPAALVARARLFVDSRAGALKEAGDLLIPIRDGHFDASHIAGELGEVASGAVAGRTDRDEVTIFKSLGMAVEDVAAAHLAVARRMARARS
jgi:alanine dehydrogenase